MRIVERILVGLLALGTIGHTIGTFVLVELGSPVFVWSLAGAFFAALLVALHVVRLRRPSDGVIAWLALVASAGWGIVALLFGHSIGNVADPRALLHAIAAFGLVAMVARDLSRGARVPREVIPTLA